MPGLNPALKLLFCRLRRHARSAWFTALTNIFGVAMAFFHPRLLFLFSFFLLGTFSQYFLLMACRSASRLVHAFSGVTHQLREL